MRRKDAVRMVELGGHGATLSLFNWSFRLLQDSFRGVT